MVHSKMHEINLQSLYKEEDTTQSSTVFNSTYCWCR